MNFNGPLANDALRQALLMALDHETMCNVTVAGMYTPGFAALDAVQKISISEGARFGRAGR